MGAPARSIAANVRAVRSRLDAAAAAADRDPAQVRLVAVSKRIAVGPVREAIAAGVGDLGENYVTELRDKRAAIDEPARWHYIGALQSSTAHKVADLADVVHSVVGAHAVERLAGRAARAGRTIDVLVEVDFTGVRTGVAPTDVAAAADHVAGLAGVRLCGLMTIAPQTPTPEGARPVFRELRRLRDDLASQYPEVVELSMGMSFDYEVAVQEGATMVRIGTAVFGPRTP